MVRQRDSGTDRQTERQISVERQTHYAHWKLRLKLQLGVAFELWLAVAIGLAGCHRFTPFAAEPSNILWQLQLYLTGKQRTNTQRERDAETI